MIEAFPETGKKRKKSISPTQRSLAMLRKEGWLCAITEKWNPHVKIRQDLFGFIDIICIKGDIVMAIQTTSGDHVAERVAKIQGLDAAKVWLESSNRQIVVHGWRKTGPRGEVKRWNCRQLRVFLSHCSELDKPSVELGTDSSGELFAKKVPF